MKQVSGTSMAHFLLIQQLKDEFAYFYIDPIKVKKRRTGTSTVVIQFILVA